MRCRVSPAHEAAVVEVVLGAQVRVLRHTIQGAPNVVADAETVRVNQPHLFARHTPAEPAASETYTVDKTLDSNNTVICVLGPGHAAEMIVGFRPSGDSQCRGTGNSDNVANLGKCPSGTTI